MPSLVWTPKTRKHSVTVGFHIPSGWALTVTGEAQIGVEAQGLGDLHQKLRDRDIAIAWTPNYSLDTAVTWQRAGRLGCSVRL